MYNVGAGVSPPTLPIMTESTQKKVSYYTGLVTFVAATLVVVIYYFTADIDVLFLGLILLIIAIFANVLILVGHVYVGLKNNIYSFRFWLPLILMLFNIPIVLAYLNITEKLMHSDRITFINDTDSDLKDIEIIGCGGGTIDELEIGESETIWVGRYSRCSIRINYNIEGQMISEFVKYFSSPSFGHSWDYHILGDSLEQ